MQVTVGARRAAAGQGAAAEARTEAVARIQALKERDNTTNFFYLAGVYLVIVATILATIWSWGAVAAAGLGWWWNIPATVLAVFVMGASQHQLAGAVHEASHFMLFRNRWLNEIAGDWLCAFPIYTTSYQYRIAHLAHHQFVNDPVRDPDISQLKESDHWLDFPMPQMDFLRAILKALLPTRLFRYLVIRAKYGAVGFEGSPYHAEELNGSKWVVRLGLFFAVAIPILSGQLFRNGLVAWSFVLLAVTWLGVMAYFLVIPERSLPSTRLAPVISHRVTAISRLTYLAIVYAGVAGLHAIGLPGGNYFVVFWVLPLFTTFPLYMVLRQWVQHGNSNRGRYTNSHVFLVNPVLRYAVFPWGQDYHLTHHLQASVPHYNLKRLHAVMLEDPEYRAKASVLHGFTGRRGAMGILEALSPALVRPGEERVHVDNASLEYAELTDAAAVRREAELSQRSG